MDRRTIAAVILIGLFLVFYYPLLGLLGLDRHLGDRRRPQPAVVDTTASAVPDTAPAAPAAPSLTGVAVPGTRVRPIATPIPTREIRIETPLYSALFSTRGARLTAVELKRYASARGASGAAGQPLPRGGREEVPPGDRVVLAGGPTWGLDFGSGERRVPLDDLSYAAAESTDASGQVRVLTFTGRDTSGLELRQTFRFDPADYAMDLEVEIRNVPAAWDVSEYTLLSRSWPLFTEGDVEADERGLRAVGLVGDNVHRHNAGSVRTPRRVEGNARWAGVQSRYFLAVTVARDAAPRAAVADGGKRPLDAAQRAAYGGNRAEQDRVAHGLVSGLPAGSRPVHRYLIYAGPSEYQRLRAHGVGLERAVDLGWSWIVPFSNALLALLKWVYTWTFNYGVAILVLATLVRLALHPLNMASMKSMRAMQKLQPEVERIRDKYKSDPQAMNAAIMALYRDNKVNPAGGCLPLLLQMPIFFALYSVLFNSIELRQAPFVAWIQDLSAPDHLGNVAGFPIRLLPLLMLGSGLLQQALTPTDPRQAPTMYIMNVVMLVFFYNLPSGLVLYWTVMNLLTALQQWLIMRGDATTGSAAVVVEPPPAAVPARARRRRR